MPSPCSEEKVDLRDLPCDPASGSLVMSCATCDQGCMLRVLTCTSTGGGLTCTGTVYLTRSNFAKNCGFDCDQIKFSPKVAPSYKLVGGVASIILHYLHLHGLGAASLRLFPDPSPETRENIVTCQLLNCGQTKILQAGTSVPAKMQVQVRWYQACTCSPTLRGHAMCNL